MAYIKVKKLLIWAWIKFYSLGPWCYIILGHRRIIEWFLHVFGSFKAFHNTLHVFCYYYISVRIKGLCAELCDLKCTWIDDFNTSTMRLKWGMSQPRHKKICFRDFRPSPMQPGLCNHRIWIEAWTTSEAEGEVCYPLNAFKPSVLYFILLTVPIWFSLLVLESVSVLFSPSVSRW